jgi:carbonic anhydrase
MRIKFVALSLIVCLVVSFGAIAQTAQTTPGTPAPKPGAQTTASEPVATPGMFWHALEVGNKEFVGGKIAYDNLKKEREVLANSQYPPMTIVSCSDSRVPPELVFNQSLGSLFVVRTAGNIVDTFGLASIEYAIANHWTMLLVVLAHEDCGAVKASLGMGDPDTPSLVALAQRIRGSFYGIQWDPANKEAVKQATIANARSSAASLLAQSKLIRQAVADGTVKVVVAYYSTTTGEVTKID